MSEARIDRPAREEARHDGEPPAGLSAADWLGLAAAPAFAVMALMTARGAGPADALCSIAHDPSPLGGMAPMYILMSAVHARPWVRLIAERSRARPAPPRRLADVDWIAPVPSGPIPAECSSSPS